MPRPAEGNKHENSYSSDETEVQTAISADPVVCLRYGIRAGCRHVCGAIRPGRYGGLPVRSEETHVLGRLQGKRSRYRLAHPVHSATQALDRIGRHESARTGILLLVQLPQGEPRGREEPKQPGQILLHRPRGIERRPFQDDEFHTTVARDDRCDRRNLYASECEGGYGSRHAVRERRRAGRFVARKRKIRKPAGIANTGIPGRTRYA